MDRGYVDFERLHHFTDEAAFFVTRTKKGIRFRRRVSRPVDFATGLHSDHTVGLATAKARRAYPGSLRRVRYVDPTTTKRLTFLTNNFTVPALAIPQLYKSRWQVELFFRWIKQHLRIKAFYGTTENAVKTQIWIALSIYVLVAIVKKRLSLEISLKLLQILSIALFEKNAHFYGSFRCRLPIRRHRQRQPIGTIRLMTGHYWIQANCFVLRKTPIFFHAKSERTTLIMAFDFVLLERWKKAVELETADFRYEVRLA